MTKNLGDPESMKESGLPQTSHHFRLGLRPIPPNVLKSVHNFSSYLAYKNGPTQKHNQVVGADYENISAQLTAESVSRVH